MKLPTITTPRMTSPGAAGVAVMPRRELAS
jgi:hypothetical protein